MWENLHLIETSGLQSVPLKSLYAMARPVWKDIVANDFKNALTLRVSMQTSNRGPNVLKAANTEIRDSQRTALATYLLSLQYAKDHGLRDMDTLFEHFLIDVQMGPDLETSRIKQATSSIQLFLHRCSLGLESPQAQQLIKTSELDFMLRYRLWEANRKAYLYPENWLDPTLRDTKSDQFRALESSLMQNKIDHTVINQLIRQYIYNVDDISNLQIEAYVMYEAERSDTLHIFGRTRTSPFIFYYRRATVSTISFYTPTWTPWTKIDIDVPVQQTDADGNLLPKPRSYLIPAIYKGRLFLFLPEITVKQTPNPPDDFDDAQDKSFDEMMPSGAWEIRMAYTEYRDRKWYPKCVARSVISHGVVDGPNTVQISDFKFWVDYEPRLSIRVECLNEGTSGKELGTFQLRDQQLVLVGAESLAVAMLAPKTVTGLGSIKNTIQTSFLKYERKKDSGESPEPELDYGSRKVKIHLGLQGALSPDFDYEWAIDFSSQTPGNTTALLVEVSSSTSIKQYIDLGRAHDFGTSELINMFPPLLLEYADKFEVFPPVNDFYGTLPEGDYIEAFGQWTERFPPNQVHYHEGAEPSAVYNWELGVHIPCLIMERLMATQQFDLALKVARQIYDPRKTSPVNACWSFPPFQRIAEEPNDINPDPSSFEMTMDEWQEDKANTHAAARANPKAYMTRIVMRYLEILIALGDEYFRRESLEATPLAIQMYIEASHIFGPQPIIIPQLGERSSVTYEDIQDLLQGWNAEVEMALGFPYYVKPGKRGASPITQLPRSTIRTGYFCIPGNPALVSLRDTIDDRLYKIRNGMDINGNKRTLPLYDPPIDPGALVRATGSGGGGIAGLLSDLDSPMPRYRFQYLISRASELVSEVRGFGSQALSLKEAKDAERLSTLRSQHQSAVAALAMRVLECRKNEIEKSIEVLKVTRKREEMHLKHILALTGDDKSIPTTGEAWKDIEQSIEPPTKDDFRMSKYEYQEHDLLNMANGLYIAAGAMKQAASVAAVLPQIGAKVQPMGAGVDTTIGGDQISKTISLGSAAIKFTAQQHEKEAERAGRKANAVSNLRERRLEANMIGRELMGIDKEVEQLQTTLATWDAEVKAQQQEIDIAAAEEEWIRTKYTSEELYTLMESTVSTLFRQTFLMAVDMIKSVRRAMDFELGLRQPSQNNTVSIASSWETCRDGLLSGDLLAIELQKLQTVFEATQPWDYEVYKSVSLRQIDPRAFLELRGTGSTSFELKESLFDRDFPGHYCRRLMEAKVYFPGAPRSVACTLSLTEHKYRVSATKASYAEQKDEDFRIDKIPITSITATKSAGGTGTLRPTFSYFNEYFPFEGAGVISKWHIELANELRQFDYSVITDVDLDINYGAIAGGDRQAAVDAAAKDLEEGSNVASIDLINDLKKAKDDETKSGEPPSTGVIDIPDLPARLPYITSRGTTTLKRVELFLKSRTEDLESLTATINEKEPLVQDAPMGEFVVGYYKEPSIDITKPWKIELKDGNNIWDGKLDEAWLLLYYSVNGLV